MKRFVHGQNRKQADAARNRAKPSVELDTLTRRRTIGLKQRNEKRVAAGLTIRPNRTVRNKARRKLEKDRISARSMMFSRWKQQPEPQHRAEIQSAQPWQGHQKRSWVGRQFSKFTRWMGGRGKTG